MVKNEFVINKLKILTVGKLPGGDTLGYAIRGK